MVLLIGNYAADQQQSMQRFSQMMLRGLTTAGIEAELVAPSPLLGRFPFGPLRKWLAYLDKFVLFRFGLRRHLARYRPRLVHICDHSNAIYAPWTNTLPTVVTCHDLLAVRGARGEETDCPASPTGKILQRWIVRGLEAAGAVACVSCATLRDAERLLTRPKLRLIPNGLNHPYRVISQDEADARLKMLPGLDLTRPFVLHVGSNLRRKNRAGVLRIFTRVAEAWSGSLVFAGEPLDAELRSAAQRSGLRDRIIEVPQPSAEILEALYNRATALLYPSRHEGFGWPIIEAQACGCPVLCADQPPMSEVAGSAGLTRPVEDEAGFAADLLRLTDPAERALWSERSLRNAADYSAARMIENYLTLYRELAPQE